MDENVVAENEAYEASESSEADDSAEQLGDGLANANIASIDFR